MLDLGDEETLTTIAKVAAAIEQAIPLLTSRTVTSIRVAIDTYVNFDLERDVQDNRHMRVTIRGLL